MRNDITLTESSRGFNVNAFKLFIAIILHNWLAYIQNRWKNLMRYHKISDIMLSPSFTMTLSFCRTRSLVGLVAAKAFSVHVFVTPFMFLKLTVYTNSHDHYCKFSLRYPFSCFSLHVCVLSCGSNESHSVWSAEKKYIFEFQLTAIKLSTNLFIKHNSEIY
jgi:hypothetical protein